MKKLMSLMLGLTLLTEVTTAAFAQTDTNKKAAKKKGKKSKKGTDSTEKKAQ
jgi:hypothetical protein